MAKVVVVYHSGFGHTEVIANAIRDGAAAVAGMQAESISVAELPPPAADRTLGGKWANLTAADVIVFGCPTYMGTVSAKFKEFMEHSGGLWYTQAWKDKLAAGFTNSGGASGDKLNTLFTIVDFAGQHSMIWINQGLMPANVGGQPGHNRLSSWIGAMSQSLDGPPSSTVNGEDAKSARAFGDRIAKVAIRWEKGK